MDVDQNTPNPLPITPLITNQNSSTKKKRLQKADRMEKILTRHVIPDDSKVNIRDIIIYDVPAKWSQEILLNHLTEWGTTISMMIKQQKKYMTVRVRIALSSFTVSSFDKGL
ncbi:hypothetical protein RclHR1_05070002 [Rhizophagus clarus]|uniref:Uncharacterized protein n=1 Tax=Rhizophagus clarus TaxID=94130 RepID=A0A2Z6RK99_9GLOM|nr:hypothetical protein RclHR1_05070002 [Rhizophagus clarus]